MALRHQKHLITHSYGRGLAKELRTWAPGFMEAMMCPHPDSDLVTLWLEDWRARPGRFPPTTEQSLRSRHTKNKKSSLGTKTTLQIHMLNLILNLISKQGFCKHEGKINHSMCLKVYCIISFSFRHLCILFHIMLVEIFSVSPVRSTVAGSAFSVKGQLLILCWTLNKHLQTPKPCLQI